jgi:hypothetical protein
MSMKDEEQAGSASEVWRLRQVFFSRIHERRVLRLAHTSSAYHRARYTVCNFDTPAMFLYLFPIPVVLLFLKGGSIPFFICNIIR